MAYYQQGTVVYKDNGTGGYYPVASANPGTYPPLPRTGYSYNANVKNTKINSSSGSFPSGGNISSSTYSEPTSSPGIDMAAYNATYEENLKKLEGNVNDYIGALTGIAQGNYDFTAKWIEANYKEALGNDDTKRAEFFKTVANDLEGQVGRIAYDYQTGSYRLADTKNTALSRLKEDERVLTRNLETERMLNREQQDVALNARGLMDSGTRQTVQGIANKDIGQLETDYERQFEALARSIREGGEDINKAYVQGQEDLTTGQRRLALDAQQAQQYQSEEAQRALEAEKKRLEAEKKGLLLEVPGLASAQAMREYGVA